eukprot:1384586-Rhodomonas_salina.1
MVREMLHWMQTNPPKPVSYLHEAIGTRLHHSAVSLCTVREEPGAREETHRMTKVHVKRRAEGSCDRSSNEGLEETPHHSSGQGGPPAVDTVHTNGTGDSGPVGGHEAGAGLS